MSPVGGPVHGVDLGQVALEGALGLHELVLGNGLMCLLSDGADCIEKQKPNVSNAIR